jgi:TolA-binding protein
VSLSERIRSYRPTMRAAIWGVAAVLVIGIVWGSWALWKTRYETQGAIALTQARALAAQSQAPGASSDTRQRAEKALQDVITEYPRLSSVGQAAYLLGSLRFANGQYAAARSSFEVARDKAGSPTLAALAALDVGYCWEAEKN